MQKRYKNIRTLATLLYCCKQKLALQADISHAYFRNRKVFSKNKNTESKVSFNWYMVNIVWLSNPWFSYDFWAGKLHITRTGHAPLIPLPYFMLHVCYSVV